MTLTITPIAEQNKASILRPFGDELAISVSSDSSLAGLDVYVMIGLYSNDFDDLPDLTTLPIFGYKVAFPGSNTTVDMNKQSHEYSFLHENSGITLQRTSATAFTLNPRGLMRADVNGLGTNLPIYALQSLLRNSVNNNVDLDNKTPGVYNTLKSLRVLVVIGDGTDVETYEYTDIPTTGRFYNKGLYDGASEFTNFDYKFTNLSVYGAGFSLNTDSVIRFSCTGTWDAGGWIAIFEDNGSNNASDYATDTNLHIKYFNGSAGAGTAVDRTLSTDFPHSAFVGFSAVTVISGTTKYVDVTLNKDYFDKTKTYRMAFIPVKANDYSNTFLTDSIEVTDYVTPTYGTVEDLMSVYNSQENTFTKCCSEITPHERLYSEFNMDKASYNAAIISNSSTGTFDENIRSIKLFVGSLAIPNGKEFDTSTSEEITTFSITNNDTVYGAATNFPMRTEWIGKQMYLTYQLVFEILQEDLSVSTDYIYFQHAFYVSDYTETGIEVIDIRNEADEEITSICGNIGIITVNYQINELGDYDVICYLDGEHDPYESANEILIKRENSKVTEVTQPTDGIGYINIDTQRLITNKEYCLEIIALNKDHVYGTCETVDINLELEYVGSSNVNITFGSITTGIKQVELIVRPITDKKFLGNQVQYFVFDTDTGETGQFSFKGQSWVYEFEIDVTIKTENNCLVQGSTNLKVIKGGTTDSDTLTLNPI